MWSFWECTQTIAQRRKKAFKQLQKKKKKSAVEQILGENNVFELSNEKLLPWFFEANDKIIKTAGGKDKYESLC